MSFFDPNNPGIGGLDELTTAEELIIQSIASLGTAGQVLAVNGTATGVEWTAAGSGANTALSNLASVAVNTTLVSDTDNTDALGTASIGWSDLFLGDGAVINFNNGDVTLTHSANTLTLAGGTLALGTNSITMTGSLGVTGARLTKGWFTDLEVTNAIAGSVTGNAATLTVADEATDTTCFIGFFTAASGSLPGKTNTNMTFNSNTGVATFASVVLTTADINGGTLDGVTIGGASAAAATITTLTITSMGGNWTNAGRTVADMGILTTVDINGGTVDGAIIGGASAAAITGTVITANTSVMPDANDGAVLGAAATAFSDLFLASGALIGFANGDAVITHSAGVIGVTTGDLRITTAGTNSASAVTVGGTQTLTSKTLTSPTINASTLGGIHQLSEGGQLRLDAAGSADGAYSGITIAGTAGATLAFGDLIYLAAADSRWELADADAASTSGDVILGMCVLAAAADADPTVVLLYGNIRADAAFPALTISAPAYVGTTAGDIQTAQPSGTDDVIRRVGFALTADELFFNPSNDYITHT